MFIQIFYNDIELAKLDPANRMIIGILSASIVNFIEKNFSDEKEFIKIFYEAKDTNKLQKVLSVQGPKVAFREKLYPALRSNGFSDYIAHLEGV